MTTFYLYSISSKFMSYFWRGVSDARRVESGILNGCDGVRGAEMLEEH
jgi:hypothetical protein